MSLEYRSTKVVDLAELARLREDAGFERLPNETLRRQIDGAHWVWSAWDGARLVGFVRAISDGIDHAYVSSMMFDSAYRRRGIGRELITRLTAGHDTIRFTLHARDARAMAFYRALGFDDVTQMMRLERKRRAVS